MGSFIKTIRDGYQVEGPDKWLRRPDPWEIARPGKMYPVQLAASIELQGSAIRIIPNRPSTLMGVAYDRPVVGYGAACSNTLRLWAAAAPASFDFAEFSHGDFVGAVIENVEAESLTRVLYPDDSTEAGRTLRFLQQYFMVSCSLQDIIDRFRTGERNDWSALPDHAAIQLNDTHPALAVAELMRILLDEAKLGWDEAWNSPTARWLTPIIPCSPRPWKSGPSSCSRRSSHAISKLFTRSTAASSTMSDAATRETNFESVV